MRENSFRRVCTVLLAVVIALAFMVTTTAEVSAASKTVKMKSYDEVIKSGKYAYCNTFTGIYRYNLKTGQKKQLTKVEGDFAVTGMKKRGKYIYYLYNGPMSNDLYRVSIYGGKAKKIFNGFDTKGVESYVISGNKIYVTYGINKHKVMKLNGKSKKKTGVTAKMTSAVSNKKGWKITRKQKGRYMYSYLKTPSKKVRISKGEVWW